MGSIDKIQILLIVLFILSVGILVYGLIAGFTEQAEKLEKEKRRKKEC